VDFHPDSENLFWLAEAMHARASFPELTDKNNNSAKKDAAKKKRKSGRLKRMSANCLRRRRAKTIGNVTNKRPKNCTCAQ
jgi:DNA-directed RNA polymerase alpha subunit